jgi:hypothetical protein
MVNPTERGSGESGAAAAAARDAAADRPQQFRATLVGRGPRSAWVFLPIPFDAAAVFGRKGHVPVSGTLNGAAYRGSLLANGDGTHAMPVNQALRASAGVAAGDAVEVTMALDAAPRTVAVPQDVQAAFHGCAAAHEAFERLAYSHRREFIEWIVQAQRDDTRARRIAKTLDMLRAGTRPKT